MNLIEVKREISDLEKIPAAEKMYPITSGWVPVTDVLAIIQRFEKHWRQYKGSQAATEAKLISEMLGDA